MHQRCDVVELHCTALPGQCALPCYNIQQQRELTGLTVMAKSRLQLGEQRQQSDHTTHTEPYDTAKTLG